MKTELHATLSLHESGIKATGERIAIQKTKDKHEYELVRIAMKENGRSSSSLSLHLPPLPLLVLEHESFCCALGRSGPFRVSRG